MNKIARNKSRIKQKIESLEQESQLIREELEGELVDAKERVLDIGKIALGIGGGLIFSAIILRSFIGKSEKNEKPIVKYGSVRVYHRFRDQLIHELSTQATGFILGIVKDRLKSYSSKNKNAENDDVDITG